MNTKWPWSSRACGISGIDAGSKISIIILILLALLASAFLPCASAITIKSGPDIQAAVSKATQGDTILVESGDYSPFDVDKALNIVAAGAMIHAAVQKPAITISSDGVSISGFKIEGVDKDTTSKFDYYMQNPQAAAGQRLDLPNAAIIVKGNDIIITNVTIFGAQAGIFVDSASNLSLLNDTFESCDSGVTINGGSLGNIGRCSFSNCNKAGIDLERCSAFAIQNNSIMNTVHVGLLLKESDKCSVRDCLFSGNTEGLALWNSSFNEVRRNSADHNYYGILLAGSDNNTVIENRAEDNSRSEIVSGFGIGISLQANSSRNVVARNTARKNFNGLELTKGCRLNAVYGNNASDNKHGLRMDKNYNNLIYGNNFIRNDINAYENASQNTWNTTIGNYYSDYKGKDVDGNGIGDQPYHLPGMDSKSSDLRPLIKQYSAATLNWDDLRAEAMRYARYSGQEEEEAKPYKLVNGAIVIESRRPTSPPKWPESKPIFD